MGYAITVSLGKIFARRFDYPLDDNQELVALGAASAVGAFFSCYTDVIIYIPNASLAAIVIVNLFSLFAQFAELKPLWRTSWADFLSFLVCLVLTITLGTEAGLIGGVVSSLLCLVICILVARKRTDRVFRR